MPTGSGESCSARPGCDHVSSEFTAEGSPGRLWYTAGPEVSRGQMPEADFFARIGLFVARDFLKVSERTRLLAEARSATAQPATVGIAPSVYAVDESVRRTKVAVVSASAASLVESHLLGLKPALEEHFGLPLNGCQPPQFLVYREGDFFNPHRDSASVPGAAEFSKVRRVATVLFLNGESDEGHEGDYGGGSLTFYGLMGDPRLQNVGLPLRGEPGVLIAFRTDIIHEVTPVTHGERFTVVSWFF